MLADGFGIQIPFTLSIWLAAEAFTIIYGAMGYGKDNFVDNLREFAKDLVGVNTIKRIRKYEDYIMRKVKGKSACSAVYDI
jgi:AAA15 family ATPase/GTPase